MKKHPERGTKASYFCEGAMASCLKEHSVAARAVATNLRHDGRVSQARWAKFRAVFESSGANLQKALQVYAKDHVVECPVPHFADGEINGNNILGQGLGNPLDLGERLVRALVLNGLNKMYDWPIPNPNGRRTSPTSPPTTTITATLCISGSANVSGRARFTTGRVYQGHARRPDRLRGEPGPTQPGLVDDTPGFHAVR